MIMITPLPGDHDAEARLGDAPVPRRDAAVVDDAGNEVEEGGGYLVLRRPWPAMLRGIYKADDRYRETYWSRFPGVYFAGDGARIDEDGDFWLLGRVDDVMNVSGHRISTIEVESALVDHTEVAEAAVIGRADAQTGQAIVAYVTLKGGAEGSVEKLAELREHVSRKIGPIAKPANIVFTPELPKTRSGKIMRRLLRDVAEHRPLGDTTTLADPAVVSEIQQRADAENGGLMRRAAVAAVAALALAAAAAAPGGELAFPGRAGGVLRLGHRARPAGRHPGRAVRRGRRVRSAASQGVGCRCASPAVPGRYDLRLRFEHGGRIVRRDEALGAWLLPPSGPGFRRERTRDVRLTRRSPGWALRIRAAPRSGRTTSDRHNRRLELRRELPGGLDREARRARRRARRYGPRPERTSVWPLSATSPSGRRTRRRTASSSCSAAPRPAALPSSTRRCSSSARPRPGSRATTGSGRGRCGRSATPRSRSRPHLPPHDGPRPRPHPLRASRRRGRQPPLGAAHRADRHRARLALGLLLSATEGENVGLLRPSTRVPLARKEGWTT